MAALEHLSIWTLITIILGKVVEMSHSYEEPGITSHLLIPKYCFAGSRFPYSLIHLSHTVTGNGPIRVTAEQKCEVSCKTIYLI